MTLSMVGPPTHTERGITSIRWSLLLALAMQAVAVSMLLPLAYLWGQPGGFSPFGAYAALIPMLMSIYLLAILAIIFFLSGLSRLHEGRDEYGPAHARDVEHVVIFLVIAFVMSVSSLTFNLPFGIFGSPSPTLTASVVVSGALASVRGLFVGLAFVFAARALVRPEERELLTYAVIALVVGPAIGAGVLALLIQSNPPASLPIPLVAMGVEAGIELLAFTVLYRSYSRVLARIRSGELPPLYRPVPFVPYVPPYAPYWAAPPYYPPYPAQPAQPAPPPQKPPEG